jgi:hypothetical protein
MLTLPHEPHDLDEPSMVEPHLGHVECAFATRTGEECILEECGCGCDCGSAAGWCWRVGLEGQGGVDIGVSRLRRARSDDGARALALLGGADGVVACERG